MQVRLVEQNGERFIRRITPPAEFKKRNGTTWHPPVLGDVVSFTPTENIAFYTWNDEGKIVLCKKRKARAAIANHRLWFAWYDNQVKASYFLSL